MPRYSIIDEEHVLKLIKEVKKREWLFNNNVDTDRPHADKLTILKGWADIAVEVGKPEPLLRQKWKSLRDMFSKEVRRCGPPDSYTGKWRFFQPLSFIYKSRKIPDNTYASDDESERGEPEYLDEEAETVSNFIKPEKDGDEVLFVEDPLKRKHTEPEDQGKKRKMTETNSEDYDVMFLTSLTPYFKQLEPLRKLVVRSKIQDMLLTELSAQMCMNKMKS